MHTSVSRLEVPLCKTFFARLKNIGGEAMVARLAYLIQTTLYRQENLQEAIIIPKKNKVRLDEVHVCKAPLI